MDSNRRVAPRLRTYLPVRLRQPQARQEVETLTKDLGLGGLRCLIAEASQLPRVLAPLRMELYLSGGHDLLTLEGRAVWFRGIPHTEQHELGVEFVNLSAQSHRLLSRFLSHLSDQPAY